MSEHPDTQRLLDEIRSMNLSEDERARVVSMY
jgi:hypothetical protein